MLLHFSISSNILPFTLSDCRPIILSLLPNQNFGPIPFGFNPLWLESDYVISLVKKTWSSLVRGSLNFIWESKLQLVKLTLKESEKPSNVTPTLESVACISELEAIQTGLETKEVTDLVLKKERESHKNLHSTLWK